ncbi:MAG: hypothetical protein ACKO40_03740 [Planctomycetaceae bacterium]
MLRGLFRTGRRCAAVALSLWIGLATLGAAGTATAAGYRTANFVVEAPTDSLARKIGDAAEQYRQSLAVEWTGSPLPRWSRPCPITARWRRTSAPAEPRASCSTAARFSTGR